MTGPLQQVHLRFNDEAGQPLAARIRVTDGDGNPYAPFGRLVRFSTAPGDCVEANVLQDDDPWAIIDGACEIAVPPGRLRIQARKGPEFCPFDEDVTLLPGKMSLRFTLSRWSNVSAEGWHAGDVCSFDMSPHAALLEARAADLAVVDLLIRERDASISNITAFSGQAPALTRPGHLVVVNTANQSPYGRLLLLNTHRPVFPLSFQRGEKWSLIDWCDQCHRKKGLVVAEDWLLRLAEGPVPELLDPDFLKRVDAIRFHPNVPLTPWFEAVSRGFKLALVAGSGKDSNRQLLGSWRTYAHVPLEQPFDYAAWTEAIRAGRTFVTNGPLVRWQGDRVIATHHGPLDRLQILEAGQVIAETNGPAATLELISPQGSLARCEGPDSLLALAPR